MKLKNLFLAGLALASMTACSNEDDPIKGGPGENANAYVQLTLIDANRTMTKTEGESTKDGSPEESKITSALVLLCDGSGLIQDTYEVKSFKPISGGVETNAFPVKCTAGSTFKVFVIANYNTNAIAAISKGSTNVKDLKTKTISDVTQYVALDNNFIMFNQSLGNDDYVGPEIKIAAENNSTDNPAKLKNPIKLDRLAAKISTTADAPAITKLTAQFPAIESVALKGYKLLNGAQDTYVQQHWLFETDNTNKPKHNTLQSSASLTTLNSKMSEYSTVKIKTPVPEVYTTVLDKAGDFSSATSPIYCLEHNSSLDGTTGKAATLDQSTGLLYQYQVTLKGTAKSEPDDHGETFGANTFFSYNGEYFATLKKLQAKYKDAFTPVDGTADPGDGAAEYSAACDLLKTAAISTDPIEANISTFRTRYNVKVYKDGIMYYEYHIKDTNYNQLLPTKSANNPGDIGSVHSILRNTVYNLTVQNLLKIGTDVPGGWNPYVDRNDPVESDELYMKVSVSVNPWVLSDQNIDLK